MITIIIINYINNELKKCTHIKEDRYQKPLCLPPWESALFPLQPLHSISVKTICLPNIGAWPAPNEAQLAPSTTGHALISCKTLFLCSEVKIVQTECL